MNKSEMRSALESIQNDLAKCMTLSKVEVALLVPKVLDELLGLLRSIINTLPEDQP